MARSPDGERRAGELSANARAPRALTAVHTRVHEGVCQYRILFGLPIQRRWFPSRGTDRRAVWYFSAGSRFALNLWACNTYGTIRWRCFVCEAIAPNQAADTVPFVNPAARVLLSTRGAAQSRLFLAWLAEREASGMDPATCPAQIFEAAHFRLHGSRIERLSPCQLSGHLA
jgi:hypothetical protein